MLRKGFFQLFFLILLFSGCIYAQSSESPLQVKASLNPIKLVMGDQAEMKITVENPKNAILFFPSAQNNEGLSKEIEILSFRIDTSFNEKKEIAAVTETLILTSFTEGQHEINGLSVRYQYPDDTTIYEAAIDPMFIHVTAIAVDTTKAIKDIKSIQKEPVTFREILPYLLAIPAIGLILLALVYAIKRYKANKPLIPLPVKPPLPAHQIALRDLETLRLKKLWQNERVKEYYTELTDILRSYMTARYGFSAAEMVSDEIIDELGKVGELNKELIPKMIKVFQTSDLVKFAKSMPLPDEHDACLQTAVSFVKQTIPQIQTEPESKQTETTITEVKE